MTSIYLTVTSGRRGHGKEAANASTRARGTSVSDLQLLTLKLAQSQNSKGQRFSKSAPQYPFIKITQGA